GILAPSDIAHAIELEKLRGPASGAEAEAHARRTPRWLLFALAVVAVGAVAFLYAPPIAVIAPGQAVDVSKDITIKGVSSGHVHGKYLLTSVAVEQPNL